MLTRERENEMFKITGMFDNGGADKDSVPVSGRVGGNVESASIGEIERSSKQAYINRIISTTRSVYNETSHNKHF
jgi:hypothetical protein